MSTLQKGNKINRAILGIALASMLTVSLPASADITEAESGGLSSRPSVWAMGIDAGLVRPVGLVATVAGAALFVVTLPFSALGGNVKESAQTLVGAPAHMTFLRCLGCTEGQDNQNRAEHAEHDDGAQ